MTTEVLKNYNTYQSFLSRLRDENSYFAELIMAVRKHYPHSNHFRLSEARAIIEAVLETGTAKLIKEGPDVGRNPDLLWVLADYMKKNPDRIQSSIGLNGLGFFYRACYKMGYIGPEFDDYRIAIREHISHRSNLRDFLNKEFETIENTYSIKYAKGPKSALVSIKYRGAFLQDITVRHFDMSRRKGLRSKDYVSFIVHEVGVWMDQQGTPIDGVAEMTATRLQQAIDYFCKKYDGERRTDALRYVFDIYQLAITENPDYPFFENTLFWTREMIFDFSIPMQLSRGYELAPVGTTSILPPYKKVLFCFERNYRPFASAHRFSVIACDFSSIKTDFYRSILINYAAQNYGKGFSTPRSFFPWLEKRKEKTGNINFTHISFEEAAAYRAYIFRRFTSPETRNSNIRTTKALLVWAVEKNMMTVDYGAWESFKWCRTTSRAIKGNARCLTKMELIAIEKTLEKMAETDVKALMSLYAFRIQLFVETRPIELCRLNIKNLRLNPDGTSTYFAPRQKNSGSDSVEVLYSPSATQTILDTIDATKDIRARCPLSCADNLFLYDSGVVRSHEYNVLSVDAYNTQLKKASAIAGLSISVISSNVRDTYMTSIKRFCHENGLTDLQRMVLTKHSRKETINAYLDINKSDFLTKANRLTFGTLNT